MCVVHVQSDRQKSKNSNEYFLWHGKQHETDQTWGFSNCSQGILDMGHSDCLVTSYRLQLQGQKPQPCALWDCWGVALATKGHVLCSPATSTSTQWMHTLQWLLDPDNLTAPPFPAAHSNIPAFSSAIWAPQWSEWLRNTNRNSCNVSVGRRSLLYNCSSHWAQLCLLFLVL